MTQNKSQSKLDSLINSMKEESKVEPLPERSQDDRKKAFEMAGLAQKFIRWFQMEQNHKYSLLEMENQNEFFTQFEEIPDPFAALRDNYTIFVGWLRAEHRHVANVVGSKAIDKSHQEILSEHYMKKIQDIKEAPHINFAKVDDVRKAIFTSLCADNQDQKKDGGQTRFGMCKETSFVNNDVQKEYLFDPTYSQLRFCCLYFLPNEPEVYSQIFLNPFLVSSKKSKWADDEEEIIKPHLCDSILYVSERYAYDKTYYCRFKQLWGLNPEQKAYDKDRVISSALLFPRIIQTASIDQVTLNELDEKWTLMKTFKLQLNTYLSNLATLLGEENCPVPLNVFRTVFINISDIMALYYESMNMAKIKVKSAARTSAIRQAMKIKGISFEQAEALLDKKSPSKKDEETDEELEQEEIITTQIPSSTKKNTKQSDKNPAAKKRTRNN